MHPIYEAFHPSAPVARQQLPMMPHIQARIDAGLRSGVLPANPSRVQILSTIGDGRYLDASTDYILSPVTE